MNDHQSRRTGRPDWKEWIGEPGLIVTSLVQDKRIAVAGSRPYAVQVLTIYNSCGEGQDHDEKERGRTFGTRGRIVVQVVSPGVACMPSAHSTVEHGCVSRALIGGRCTSTFPLSCNTIQTCFFEDRTTYNVFEHFNRRGRDSSSFLRSTHSRKGYR